MKRLIQIMLTVMAASVVVACYPPTPHNVENICDIFMEYPGWYWDAKATEQKWGVPVATIMSIMYTESGFQASATPGPAPKFSKVFPWKPASSAVGYCQALKGMWECYQQNMHKDLSRDDFASASDFIGWYAHLANQMDRIAPNDSYDLYLAYHEGIGAFKSHAFYKRPWVIPLAHKVAARALLYNDQLKKCEGQIPQPSVTDTH